MKILKFLILILISLIFTFNLFIQISLAASSSIGIVGYFNTTPAPATTPRYKIFDSTNLGSQQNALGVIANPEWVVVRSSSTRNESIMGTIVDTDTLGIISTQVYNWATNTWGNAMNMTTALGTTNDAYQGFSIAYEQNSGDALIVYNNGTRLNYNIWNGTAYVFTSDQLVPNCPGVPLWTELAARNSSTDEILMGSLNATTGAICVEIWNGTTSSWIDSTVKSWKPSVVYTTKIFDVEWSANGDGLVVFESGSPGAMSACRWTAGAWCSSVVASTDVGSANIAIQLSPIPNTSSIAIGTLELQSTGDLNWFTFNTTANTWSAAGADAASTTTGDMPISVVGINSTHFIVVYNDAAAGFTTRPRYVVCTAANSCTAVADVVASACYSTETLDFINLYRDPFSSDAFLVVSTLTTHTKCAYRWSSNAWSLIATNFGSGVSLLSARDFSYSYNALVPDTTPPLWTNAQQNVSNPHREEYVNISALWSDDRGLANATLSTNETGAYKNYTDGTYNSNVTLSGVGPTLANFTWRNVTGNPRVIGWVIYGADFYSNNINGTNCAGCNFLGNFTMYGWSNITWTSPSTGSSFRVEDAIQLLAFVNDTNITGSGPIQNYPVNFYLENSSQSTLLGTNYTNSSGYAVWNWDTTGLAAGTYYPKTNITNNSTLYYNASEYQNANTTITLNPPCYAVIKETQTCYQTIQSAINAATNGQTVLILKPKWFNENVVLNRSITLSSNSSTPPTINSTGTSLLINANGATVSNLTIAYNGTATSQHVVWITGNYTTVANNTIRMANINSNYPVYIQNSANNTIYGNNITSRSYGVYTVYLSGSVSTNNTIDSNNISYDATSSLGIYIAANNNTIKNNNITSTGGYVPIYPNAYYNTVVIDNNNYNGKPIIYNKTLQNSTITATTYGELILANSFNMTITNSAFNESGILFISTTNSTITNSNITTRTYAIWFISSSGNNTIYNNNISTSGSDRSYGIALSSGNYNNITNNNITITGTGTNWGIDLEGSSDYNTISSNIIRTSTGGGTGIWINTGSNYNNIFDTNITTAGTAGRGITLYNSNNTNITSCNITTTAASSTTMETSSSLWGGDSIPSAIQISGGNNNRISNCILNSTNYYDIFVSGTGNQINYLINTTYNKTDIKFNESSNIKIYNQYYLDVYVNDTFGNPLNSANVFGNDTDAVANTENPTSNFTATTNSSGYISQQALSQFMGNWTYNSTTGYLYFTNYTVNASKTGFTNNSTTVNLTSNNLVVLTLTDNAAPTWSSNSTSIVPTYSPTTLSQFNITWTDSSAVSTAFFESNISGSPANYTMTSIATNVYNYNNTLPAGTFYWKSYANDTLNNWNVSNTWYFTINKTQPVLILNNNTAAVNTSGLVGYWRFENESLGYATDYSGWNNTGTLTNMNNAGNATSGPTGGRFGKAMQFDGVNDYVTTNANFADNVSALTVTAWVNSYNGSYALAFVSKDNGGSERSWYFGMNDATSFKAALWTSTGRTDITMSGFNLNEWTFVAFVYNSSHMILYRNGIPSTPSSKTGVINKTTAPVAIGSTSGGYFFNGTIDEVQIWNRSLTADEIKELYESNVAYGTQTNFTFSENNTGDSDVNYDFFRNGTVAGVWHFDEGSGNTAVDSSGNGNTGTLTNMNNTGDNWNHTAGVPSGWTTGKYGNGLGFDGVNDYILIPDSDNWYFGSGDFTIDFWVNLNSLQLSQNQLFYGQWQDSNNYFYFLLWNGNSWQVQNKIASSDYSWSRTTTLSTGTWYHMALVRSGNTMYIFQNGTQLGASQSFTQTLPNYASPLYISISWGAINGTVDEYHIYPRALSAAEILCQYGNNCTQAGFNNETNVLPAGYHYYSARASEGQNYTTSNLLLPLNVTPLPNPIDIYFINSTGEYKNQNMTISTGTQITANITMTNSNGGTANLYLDNSLVSNPNTTTLSVGVHSYTGNTTGAQNYSSNSTTYYVTVGDFAAPIWQNQGTNDTDNIILQGQAINLTAQGKDETALDWAWLSTNETGVWKNYTTIGIGTFANWITATQSDFNLGTYNQTFYNATNGYVQLQYSFLGDGSDGALTVTTANYVVNNYTQVSNTSLSVGNTVIGVGDASAFSAGDEILIIQMQNNSNGIAGTYEFKNISSKSGNVITLSSGLSNAYYSGTFNSTTATVTQIVRVPQYTNVTINSGGSITATTWDGFRGGIVVFRATGTVTVNSGANITVNGKGYRGGDNPSCGEYTYGRQGESSKGYGSASGVTNNVEGGGGGQKYPNCYASGGAGGGYATSGGNGGNAIVGGCSGGTGGSIIGSSDLSKLNFGGGGGAGGCKYTPGRNGGISGGIIFVAANNITASGPISANGGVGTSGLDGDDDAGGGGAGGSIYLITNLMTLGTNLVNATGGAGGTGTGSSGGGAGGNGRIRLDYNIISGTTNPGSGYNGTATYYSSGNYISKVFDASSTAQWNNISWTEGVPYGEELPDNKRIESVLGGANMTGNVLLMHMNEASGTIVDTSGSGNNGTVTGATYGASGKFNTALSFDGSGDYIFRGDSPSLVLTSSGTVAAWVRLSSLIDEQTVVIKSNSGGGTGLSYGIQVETVGCPTAFQFWVDNDGSWGPTVSICSATVTTGTWYHVVGTWDSTGTKIYVNGVLSSTASTTTALNAQSTLYIGGGLSGWTDLTGIIDEVAIWNRTLSATEILNHYKRGALRLNITTRSCDDAACSGENWNNTYTNATLSTLQEQNNRYFQWKANFETDNTSYTPQLYNVTVNYNATGGGGGNYNSPMNMTKNNQWQWSNFTWSNSSVPDDSLISWKIYYNDTSGNENVTNTMNFAVSRPPLISILSPLNQSYAISSVWANATLNKTASWCGAELDSTTNYTMSNSTGNWNYQLTSLTTGSHNVKFYCNSTFNVMNSTDKRYFSVDVTAPIWQNQGTNDTDNSILQGQAINLTAQGKDETALDWSWLATNESGSWRNYTSTQILSTFNDSTTAKNISFSAAGSNVSVWIKLPKNINVTSAKVNVSGYQQSSSPFVYSWNGSEYVYETDILAGFDSKDKESISTNVLMHMKEPKIKITNEVDEIEYIDYLRLRVTTTNGITELKPIDKLLLKDEQNYLILKKGDEYFVRFEPLPINPERIELITKGYYIPKNGNDLERYSTDGNTVNIVNKIISTNITPQVVPHQQIIKTFGNSEMGNINYPTQNTSLKGSPIEIISANLSKIDVKPGDILTVTVEVKSDFGIKEIIADMGGIENVTLQKISGNVYSGTWQKDWLVHSTENKIYTVTLFVRDNAGNELIDRSLGFADPTFGLTSTGSTTYPTGTVGTTSVGDTYESKNILDCNRFTAPVNLVINSVYIYNKLSSNEYYQVGAYDDSSGPNSLVTSVLSSSGYGVGWIGGSVTPAYFAAGSYIWLCADVAASTFWATVTTGGTEMYKSLTYGSSWPNPAGTMTSDVYKNSIFSYYVQTKGYAKATKAVLSDNGANINSVSFYSHSTGNFRLAIYSDSSGPSSKLWESGSTAATASAWNTVNINSGTPTSLTLNAGTYWFVWQWDSVNSGPSYTVGSSGDGNYISLSYGSFPSTWSGGTSSSEKWSVYASYTTYPINLTINLGNTGVNDWSYADGLNSSNSPQTATLNITKLNEYLSTCTADAQGYCTIPINVTSSSAGIVQLNALAINYNFYNSPMDMNDAVNTWTWSNFTWSNSSVADDTLVSWKIYYNDTSNNQNVTDVMSFSVSRPPLITILSPLNQSYGSSSVWANVSLNKAGSWCGAELDSSTNYTMSNTTGNWNYLLTGLTTGSHSVKFYCNNSLNAFNTSDVRYFSVDVTPPIWQNQGTNDTDNIIQQGQAINLTAQGKDETALDWSWLSTNETGSWRNYTTSGVVGSWWNSSWTRRKNITINNSANSNNLTNYQVFVNVTYDSDMNTTFKDLRFTYYNSTSGTETEISYWIESNISSSFANVWVNVTRVQANSYQTVYMYYGNPSASYTGAPFNSTSTVGTSTTNEASDSPLQRKSFYANGRFWVWYSDGTNLVFTSSTNATTWESPTTVRACAIGNRFSIWFDGTYVHYAYSDPTNFGNPLYYRRGIPNNNGTITWSDSEQSAVPSTGNYRWWFPTIATDSNGYVFIGYYSDYNNAWSSSPYVTKNNYNNGTWSTASGFPYSLGSLGGTQAVLIVPLNVGKMYVLYTYGTTASAVKGRFWNGSSWGNEETVTSSTGVSVGSDSAVAIGDDVYLLHSNTNLNYTKRTNTTSTWSSEVTVQSTANPGVLTIDSSTGNMYAFWTGSPTANHIYYKKFNGTAWDSSPTDWITETALTANNVITSYYKDYGGAIGLVYMNATASPYQVRFKYYPLLAITIGSEESPSQGASSYNSPMDMNNAVNTWTWSNFTWSNSSVADDTLVSWRIYYNDTAGNENVTSVMNFAVSRPPLITILSPLNQSYAISSVWANVTLNKAGSWCGAELDSTTNYTMSNTTGNWNYLLTSLTTGSHNVKFYCNSTFNVMNSTDKRYFSVDVTAPIWQNQGTNDTDNSILQGQAINLTAQGKDETALDWAWLATNESGQWSNYSSIISSSNTTTFNDSTSAKNITFNAAGNSVSAWIKLPKGANVNNATINVSGFGLANSTGSRYASSNPTYSEYESYSTGSPATETSPGNTTGKPDGNYGYLLITDAWYGDTFWNRWWWDLGSSTNATWRFRWRGYNYNAYPSYTNWVNWKIEVSNDNSAWTTVTSVTTSTAGYDTGYIITNITGTYRYSRATIDCTASSAMCYAYLYIDAIEADSLSPNNVTINLGNTQSNDWSYTGELNTSVSPNKVNLNTTKLTNTLSTCTCSGCTLDASNNCTVPINVSSDSQGTVQLSSLSINYTSIYNSAMNMTKNNQWQWSNFTWQNNSIADDTLVSWKIYYNDTSGNENVTNTMNFAVSRPPLITILSPLNQSYGSSSVWANVTLNKTGSWCGAELDSTTNYTMSNSTGNWNYQLTSLTTGSHNVKFYCNTTVNAFNISDTRYFYVDVTAPIWQNQGTNDTDNIIQQGQAINLTAQGKDETALDWAWLATNENGVWQNKTTYSSPMNMAKNNQWQWSNFTWSNSSVVPGTTIGWRIYYNDTSGNQNVTDIMTFLIPAPGNFVNMSLNTTQVWWQDVVNASGFANVTVQITVYADSTQVCNTVSSASGLWSCAFTAPTGIGTYHIVANIGIYATSKVINLKVFPFYGTQGIGSTPRVVYEVPFLIQDLNGSVQKILVRIAVSK